MQANELPTAPGVYLMMDESGKVIYVGKAKRLRNRVSQYFQENSGHNEKTRRMVSLVDHFDTIIVSSEFEALILENSLIKQHMPRYNILLKDDKGYPFIRLSADEYPRFSLVNRPARDGARYFGPFGGRQETRAAIDSICSAFHLPTCTRQFPRDIGKERPCLNHHMGRCDGFCRGEPDAAEYARRIEQAVELLSGRYRQLTNVLREEMLRFSEALQFEQAAILRDRITALETLGKRQKVIAGICADTDLWGLCCGTEKSAYAVLHVEEGQLTQCETGTFTATEECAEGEMLDAVLRQYYLERSVVPREILLPLHTEESDALADLLSQKCGRRVRIRIAQRGEKAELLTMAARNAKEELERATTVAQRENGICTLLAKMLSIEAVPGRIESYDISNTGGSDIVASMVVFDGTRPSRRSYRRFKIKSLDNTPDDYASMEEVLTRRLQRYCDGDEKFSPLPTLMLIDGGITHAAVAERVCKRFGIALPIFGMVKDDRHRTRALVTAQGREIGIQSNQAVFSLIGQIQEETHRFAITFHHERHTRTTLHTALDDIAGIGKVRKQALLRHFKSVKAIREADLESLCLVLPKSAAESVYRALHEESKGS